MHIRFSLDWDHKYLYTPKNNASSLSLSLGNMVKNAAKGGLYNPLQVP